MFPARIFNYKYLSEYLAISPQKIILALMNTIIILKILKLGGGAFGVSVAASFNILSSIFIGAIAPRYLVNYDRIRKTLMVSYLIVGLFTFIVSLNDLLLVYISALFIFLSTQIIYYDVYLSINLNGYRDKSIFLSKLETVGGVSWIIGLILGVILTLYLNLNVISRITSFLSITGIICSIYYAKYHYRIYHHPDTVRRFYDIIVFLKSMISYSNPYKIYTQAKKIFSSRTIGLAMMMILIQLSISIAFTHLIPYIVSRGFSYSKIFILSLFSSTAAAFTYSEAGRRYKGKHSLMEAIIYRFLVYMFFIIDILIGIVTNSIYGFVFIACLFILIGVSWGFLYINLGSIVLGLDRKNMSYVNLSGGIGSIIGAYISGFLFSTTSYAIQIAISSIILLFSLYISWKYNIFRLKSTSLIRLSIPIHNISIANQVYFIRRRNI